MKVNEAIEQIGQIAEQARARRAQSFPLSAEFLREKERHIIAYLCSWNTLAAGAAEDGSPVWNAFQRHCFDNQLAQRSPTDTSIRLKVFHDIDIGYWGPLTDVLQGLRGVGVPRDEPAAYELIEAINDGRSTHVSLAARVIRSRERHKPGPGGWPIHDILEGWIIEGGPCPTDLAKDAGAVILEVGGVEPRWIDEVHRTKVMSGLRPVPRLAR